MANEIRLRTNNVQGVTTDNPLTAGATTINSAGFVDLPTVDALSHLVLILDPLETAGPAEIVMVTAHTAASTQCTIVRAQEGSTARSHAAGTTWFHGPTVADWNYTDRAALSSNRPTSPFNGQLIYETDTHRYGARINGVWQPSPHNVPACRVFNNANQSVPDAGGGLSPVLFNTEYYDTDSMHSTSVNTGRITFNTPGVYSIGASVRFQGAADYLYVQIGVSLNSGNIIAVQTTQGNAAGYEPWLTCATHFKFAANDFITLFVFQDNTANAARNLLSSVDSSPAFWATWIGVG